MSLEAQRASVEIIYMTLELKSYGEHNVLRLLMLLEYLNATVLLRGAVFHLSPTLLRIPIATYRSRAVASMGYGRIRLSLRID